MKLSDKFQILYYNTSMDYELFKNTIQNANKILIISHVNPDGDTLGSMSALYQVILNNFNIQKDCIDMVYNGIIPEIYKFIPYLELAQTPDMVKHKQYDLVISVDIAAKDRMGDSLPLFENIDIRMNIDHHKTNNNFGTINFVRADACSCGEVLLDIFNALKFKIDKRTACALYAAILTDTGGFRYENTTAQTLLKASELISLGANPAEICRYCYESKPRNMVLLHANCMINAEFSADNKIAGICITNKDMEKFHATNDYTEGLVEELRRIKTTEVSFVIKEVDENTSKVSLRSKNTDVSLIAQVFGGGGHTFAAGCTIRKPLNIAKDKLVEEIKKVLG